MAPVSSKEFLLGKECRFTLTRVRDMIKTYSLEYRVYVRLPDSIFRLLQIDTITKFLLIRMKCIIKGGCLIDD